MEVLSSRDSVPILFVIVGLAWGADGVKLLLPRVESAGGDEAGTRIDVDEKTKVGSHKSQPPRKRPGLRIHLRMT